MWLGIIFLSIFGWLAHRLAYKIFGTRWSPITIYFSIWILLLFLYSLRWISYPPLYAETWIVIGLNFFIFWLGVMTPAIANLVLWGSAKTIKASRKAAFVKFIERKSKLLKAIILVLCIVSFLAVVGQYAILLNHYGGFYSLLTSLGSVRYDYATSRLNFGILDYIAMLPFVATIFGGCYSGVTKKRSVISYLPLFVILIWAIPITARMNILWGFLLFFNAFALSRIFAGRSILKLTRYNVLVILGIVILLTIIFNLFWLGRMGKGEYSLFVEVANPKFVSAKEALVGDSAISQLFFGNLISNYAYSTLYLAHMNFYLHETRLYEDKMNKSLTGVGSFAAAWRLMRKIGLIEVEDPLIGGGGIPWPEIPTGPKTYISEIYYDFGLMGIVLFPYLLGSITSFLFFSTLKKPRFVKMCVLVILYLFIQMSWFGSIFNHTAPVVCLLISLLIAAYLDVYNPKISNI